MTREEVIKILWQYDMNFEPHPAEDVMHAIDMAIEVLQQEPIIHCKDCKYWQDNNNGYPVMDCRWNKDETPDADDFCSFAERLESDEK